MAEFNLASEDKQELNEIHENFEKGIADLRQLQQQLMKCVNTYMSSERPDLVEQFVANLDEHLHKVATEYKHNSGLFDNIKNTNIPRYSQQRRILTHEREFINQTNKELLRLKRGEIHIDFFLKWLVETDAQYIQRRIPLSIESTGPGMKHGRRVYSHS